MFKDIKDKKKISYSNILQKLSQENVSIYKQIEKISAERNKLRSELIQIKEEKSCGQEQIVEENEKLKTKLFLIEQKMEKTKNLYEISKKKLERKNSKILKTNEINNIRSKSQNNHNHKDTKKNYTNPTILNNDKSNINNNINKKFFENILEKKKNDIEEESNEIYILEPSKAILKLNNELIFYKDMHQKFLTKLKKKQETIIKYENLIDKLNSENTELRKQYKLKLMKVNNEKENILSIIVQNNLNIDEQSNNNNNILNKNKKMSSGISLTTTDNNDNSSNTYNTAHTLEQLNLNNSQLKKIINKDEIIGKESTLEEFGAILKSVGLTRELFEKMSQIKGFGKLTDSIEFFYKLCLEKNKQLLILEKENESLVFKNYELNKLNIELENELKLYKNNKENNNRTNVKKILDDDSILNNNSRTSKLNNNTNYIETNLNINEITNNKNNTNISNPIVNYKKLLEKQKEEGQLKKAELIFNLSLEKDGESSSSIKNSNNKAEILDNDNDNEKNDKENDYDDNENDNQFYSDSKSYDDIQFRESYNEVTNSNIDSIMSKDFNNRDSDE